MGKFRPEDPKSPELDKGYRLRDTDDRLHRMKAQAAKHRSEAVILNGYCNNGKVLYMKNVQIISLWFAFISSPEHRVLKVRYCDWSSSVMWHQQFALNHYSSYTPRLIDLKPASVAQLDAHLTGDQEVGGSTPAGLAIFFRRD